MCRVEFFVSLRKKNKSGHVNHRQIRSDPRESIAAWGSSPHSDLGQTRALNRDAIFVQHAFSAGEPSESFYSARRSSRGNEGILSKRARSRLNRESSSACTGGDVRPSVAGWS